MERKINSAKISPTAHITSYAWDELGISNAEYFVDPTFKSFYKIIRLLGLPLFLDKKNDYTYFMLEPRHRAIDYFMFSKFPYKQVVELACGLSPRGMTFAENPEITYVESDLPKMLETKKNKVNEIYRSKNINKDNHKFVSIDIINDDLTEKLKNIINPELKTIVLTEGLTPYFDMEHLKVIFTKIHKFLKENSGGVYITDIYHEEDLNKNYFSHKIIQFVLKMMQAQFHLDIDNINEGEAFFKECGFDFIETINPLEVSKQLGLKTNIPAQRNTATIYLAHVF